jgi:hypothetical protein
MTTPSGPATIADSVPQSVRVGALYYTSPYLYLVLVSISWISAALSSKSR